MSAQTMRPMPRPADPHRSRDATVEIDRHIREMWPDIGGLPFDELDAQLQGSLLCGFKTPELRMWLVDHGVPIPRVIGRYGYQTMISATVVRG
jgi:hypothetical protein